MIDAGLAPKEERGQLRFTDHDLALARQEELDQMRTIHLYPNQYYRWEEDFMTRDMILNWKFITPTITTLEEAR